MRRVTYWCDWCDAEADAQGEHEGPPSIWREIEAAMPDGHAGLLCEDCIHVYIQKKHEALQEARTMRLGRAQKR